MNHPTTVALIVPNYAQLATMWYQKLAKPIAAPFPGVDELNDPRKSHLELFDAPEFKQLISDEVCMYMYVSMYVCMFHYRLHSPMLRSKWLTLYIIIIILVVVFLLGGWVIL